MSSFFNKILYQPLFNLLMFFNQYFHDLGWAIVVLTIIIRFILLPFFYKSSKDQAILQKLAPQIKEIQKNHKNDINTQTQAMLALYKDHKVSPWSSLIFLAIQLPILFALYKVFLGGVQQVVGEPLFLGLINLTKPNIFVILATALATFLQSVVALQPQKGKTLSPTEQLTKRISLLAPLWTVIFLFFLPSALGLYVLTSILFSVVQQIFINKALAKQAEQHENLKDFTPKISN